jgi:hypothetical protein
MNSFDYKRVKQEADADKRLYDELVRKVREAGINASFQNNAVRISDQARPAWKQTFPDMKLNILLAFVFSTLIGGAILADTLDNTLRDPEQVQRTLNTTVVGTLPAVKENINLQIALNKPIEPALLPPRGDAARRPPTMRRSVRCEVPSS